MLKYLRYTSGTLTWNLDQVCWVCFWFITYLLYFFYGFAQSLILAFTYFRIYLPCYLSGQPRLTCPISFQVKSFDLPAGGQLIAGQPGWPARIAGGQPELFKLSQIIKLELVRPGKPPIGKSTIKGLWSFQSPPKKWDGWVGRDLK